MSDNVGSANVEITADDSQARSKLNGFFGFLKGTGKIAAGVAGGIAIFQGISGAISGASKATIGANADMESYLNTLTVVMKDSKKAAQTLAWAKDFANKTPFETNEVVDATAKLTSYGLNAKKVMTDIGNMAAVMNKPLDQAVEAIADAQTGELERLKEFGITKNMIIKQAKDMRLGLVVNNKGQITDQKKFNQALFALLQKRFKGGMKLQSQTWKGMMSNIRGFMSNAIQTLSQPLFKKLESGLQHIMPLFDGLTSLMNGDVKGFNDSLKKVFGGGAASVIIGFFNTTKKAVSAFKEGFNNGFTEMQSKTETVAAFLGNAFYKIKDVLGKVAQFVVGVYAVLFGHSSKGETIFTKLGFSPEATKKLITFINNVKTMIGTMVSILVQEFQMLGQNIMKAWDIIGPYIVPILKDMANFVMSIVAKIVAFWQANGTQIMNAVKTVFNIILGVIKFVMPLVSSIIGTAWNMIKGIIKGALNIIFGLFKIFAGLFTGDWGKLWEGVKQVFSGAWNIIKSIFGGIFGFIGDVLGWLKDVVVGAFKYMWDYCISGLTRFKNTFTNIWHSVVSWLSNKFDEMVTTTKNRFNAIVDTAKNIFGKIKDAIMTPIKAAVDKVKEWINDIKGFLKNLKVKIPTPHFSVSGSFNPAKWIKGDLPKLHVKWNAAGALFKGPSIFSTPYGLQGFGEAGDEAALPLTKRVLGTIGAKIAALMPGNGQNVLDILQSLGPIVLQLPMDSDVVAQRTYKNIFELMQKDEKRNNRFGGES